MPRGHRVRLLTGPVKFIYVRVRLHIRDASSTSTEGTNVYEPCTTNIAKDRRVNHYRRRGFDKTMCTTTSTTTVYHYRRENDYFHNDPVNNYFLYIAPT